jgi:hypothetical protein
MWSKAYRYSVPDGIRQVMVMLTRHVPSHLTVDGHRVLLSYDKQPATCYGCGETKHPYQGCPARQRSRMVRPNSANATYASIVSANAAPSANQEEDMMIETGFNKKHETAEHTTPDLNVPIKGTDSSIIDSEAFHPARVGPPLLPAEERDAAANRSQLCEAQ